MWPLISETVTDDVDQGGDMATAAAAAVGKSGRFVG